MGQLRKQAEAVNEEAYERLDNIEAAWLKKHMTGKENIYGAAVFAESGESDCRGNRDK